MYVSIDINSIFSTDALRIHVDIIHIIVQNMIACTSEQNIRFEEQSTFINIWSIVTVMI